MKRSIIAILAVMMLFSTQSCSDFDEVNTNPNSPTEVPSGLLISDLVFRGVNRMYNTFVGGDMGSGWAQHWAKIQYNDEMYYVPRETATQGMWYDFFEDVVNDSEVMRKLAIEEGNTNMQGVALVLKAWGFLTLTDCYGNIPFSEALGAGDGNFTPAYDEEETVYTGALAWLDEANELFAADGGTINSTTDLLYGGDWEQWQKFANSLKFRALMRISSKDGDTDIDVAGGLAEIFTSREFFGSADDEAKLDYLVTDPNANPVWETINFDGRKEFRINEAIVEELQFLSDPRLMAYAQPAASDGEYRGKPSGIIGVPNADWNGDNVSELGVLYIGDQGAADVPEGYGPKSPGFILSYSELMFLMAEASVKGYIGGDATAMYNSGIQASFEYNLRSTAEFNTYIAQGSVNLDVAPNKAERIQMQNWIGLFGQGIEAWTEQRRTGIPELTPAIDGAIDEIPSRYFYPNIESSINSANYDAASAAIGGNLLTSKIWWME